MTLRLIQSFFWIALDSDTKLGIDLESKSNWCVLRLGQHVKNSTSHHNIDTVQSIKNILIAVTLVVDFQPS